ncbi:MAG TPA: hypothetical protein IGS53_06360 [Leptolyngbyaceae cyanobacterium M33_DOE_097]|uniref:Uncharacterized protein n=1 Tax=Oscillatoriales cyanobacterium SpSt-418 TaxID=2282169 RepID=A0A7C3PKE9_9CYAN|nr:hypothetical protein [Leptolyngbyaceae cyanobacterium M33_DOE_097]
MSASSSIETLNQVIRECNPFESNFIVKSHHVWDEDFLDLPCLHAHASETILEAVTKINSGKLKSKTSGFAVLAPKGVGKTHVLSRIRHHLKQTGEGFFIYMCEYGNLSSIRHQFLQSLAFSLKKLGSQGVMQWQELATALANKGMGKDFAPQQLIERFPQALARNPQAVTQLTQKVLQKCPEIDNPYIVKAILWTLSQAHAPFAINWLAGRELSEAQAKMMDLPDVSKENRETEVSSNISQILNLISYHTTPVICFDELDGTELADEADPMLGGYSRAQVVASLAKDVYNSLQRGIIVTALYAQTWREEFQSISQSGAIKDRIAHKEIALTLLKPDDTVMLVAFWLENFYTEKGLIPPHAVYPFDENSLRELGNGATIREILQWCAQNFSPVKIDPIEKLEKIYQQVESTLDDFSDDSEKIANALAFVLHYIRGKTVEGVTLKKIDREINPKWKHKGRINFRIVGEENGKEVKIGVCVSQDSNGKSVGACIKYLTLYSDLDFTRGCLVRSKSIQKNWQVAKVYLKQLLDQQGGEWVSFKDEHIKPLLALHKVHKELDRESFTEEDFRRFIDEKHPVETNLLVCEILSDPSGQNPEEVIDEDSELERLFSEEIASASDDEITDALELLSVA